VLHAQDRFFQMDLLRRKAAGELSALVGGAALPLDKQSRAHRFRSRMKTVWEGMTAAEKLPIQKYCDGVAWGLANGFVSENAKPFEYHLLRTSPEAWQPEDCLLCVCSMYLELQSSQVIVEKTRGKFQSSFPPEVARFFDVDGTAFDAAIDGTTVPIAPFPSKEVLDFRQNPRLIRISQAPNNSLDRETPQLGSNNWAVAGKHTKHGGAIVCDDMHLAINLPNIWYRAALYWTDPDGTARRACGVTLPGGPAIVAGSNGFVAWGFTNTEGDWLDLLLPEFNPNDMNQYKASTGWMPFTVYTEQIAVKGEPAVTLQVQETEWGPMIDEPNEQAYIIRWVAHQPGGVNLKTMELLQARTIEQAMDTANQCGIPHQNCVIGDKAGRIAWTIAGRIPKRPVERPRAWVPAVQHVKWDGFVQPSDYPRVIDPAQGRIWTANNRVVGGAMFAMLGNGGVDIGHRAGQIRDRLLALPTADEKDMLQVQLDNEARSMQRWKKLFLETVSANESRAKRAELRKHVEAWDGFARVEGVGYTVLTHFRNEVRTLVYEPLVELQNSQQHVSQHYVSTMQQMEGPLWTLIEQKPMHLLHPRFPKWEALFLDAADRAAEVMQEGGTPIHEQHWGVVNGPRVRHPLSAAIPLSGRWLNRPDTPLPGARRDLPRVSSPGHGASERFAVSPGREEQGIFHMPGGQSGHPLSPHYLDGHAAWEQGLPTPFLPGPKVQEMVLVGAGK
jgi:penicillin G amidase